MPVEDDPVDAVFIHCAKTALIERQDLDPRVKATRSFLQTALVLRAQGKVDVDCPARVVAELERKNTSPATLQQWTADAAARFDVDVDVDHVA